MDVKTIVCPNCGASATNFHNCEYCGSFLVQRAHEDVDLTDYVKSSSKYVNEGILKEVKKFIEFVKNNPDSDSSLNILYKDRDIISLESNSNPILMEAYDLEIPGVCICLLPEEYEGILNKKMTERFENSSLYNTFKKESCYADDNRLPSEIPWNESQYYVDFGFDHQGAALVVSQFLEDVVQLKYEYIKYSFEGLEYSPKDADNIDFNSIYLNRLNTRTTKEKKKSWIWYVVAAIILIIYLILDLL
ncbi:MAG: hypothetical protein IKU03_00515 [Bacteroidales bacterium]|nr:hypothetical protein [Bacteroidales bacterium]